jgi:hypothetical protein
MTEPDNLTSEDKAEIMRKKNRYRELILSGRLVLSHTSAARLLGPDSLYRLYSMKTNKSSERRHQRGTSR